MQILIFALFFDYWVQMNDSRETCIPVQTFQKLLSTLGLDTDE